MARPLRIQYPGAVYHVTCRGNERKNIFGDDSDRKKMLEILARSMKIYNVTLYSYVLMSNHFHLLVETPLGNLGEFISKDSWGRARIRIVGDVVSNCDICLTEKMRFL